MAKDPVPHLVREIGVPDHLREVERLQGEGHDPAPADEGPLTGCQRFHEDVDRRHLIDLRDPVGEPLGSGRDGTLV
jgi:hypothetical protein